MIFLYKSQDTKQMSILDEIARKRVLTSASIHKLKVMWGKTPRVGTLNFLAHGDNPKRVVPEVFL
jgi:hypothetical protein